jgi:protein TonB
MFENSQTWQRWSAQREPIIRAHLGHVPYLEDEGGRDRKVLIGAIVAAAVLHLLAFVFVRVPDRADVPPMVVTPQRVVYTFSPVRYQPPPPQAEQRSVPRTRKKTIPIPDPTPDEPEPLLVTELELPETDIDELVVGIPEAPPAARFGSGWHGSEPLQVGGDVSPPVKVYSPVPRYTEDARKGRVQGVVILQAIIDDVGNVNDVSVLKGLPLGLSESAMETVKEWKFKPARKNGVAVPVFFNLTVTFSLQ